MIQKRNLPIRRRFIPGSGTLSPGNREQQEVLLPQEFHGQSLRFLEDEDSSAGLMDMKFALLGWIGCGCSVLAAIFSLLSKEHKE